METASLADAAPNAAKGQQTGQTSPDALPEEASHFRTVPTNCHPAAGPLYGDRICCVEPSVFTPDSSGQAPATRPPRVAGRFFAGQAIGAMSSQPSTSAGLRADGPMYRADGRTSRPVRFCSSDVGAPATGAGAGEHRRHHVADVPRRSRGSTAAQNSTFVSMRPVRTAVAQLDRAPPARAPRPPRSGARLSSRHMRA